MTSPCILELQYYHLSLSRMILLRQYHQHRIAALLLAKHADYNSLEKKRNSANFKAFLQHSMENKSEKKKRNQTGEVEGKGEMKDGESS